MQIFYIHVILWYYTALQMEILYFSLYTTFVVIDFLYQDFAYNLYIRTLFSFHLVTLLRVPTSV